MLETVVPLSNRRFSRPIFLNDRKGNTVQIGGGAPVVVQSMCSTDTSDKETTISKSTISRRMAARSSASPCRTRKRQR